MTFTLHRSHTIIPTIAHILNSTHGILFVLTFFFSSFLHLNLDTFSALSSIFIVLAQVTDYNKKSRVPLLQRYGRKNLLQVNLNIQLCFAFYNSRYSNCWLMLLDSVGEHILLTVGIMKKFQFEKFINP